MRILFCNIAKMKYYKGIFPDIDEPENGGEYVNENGDAYEKYNFCPEETVDGEYCFGFDETKSTNGKVSNQMHIERLEGVPSGAEEAHDVLVVWCALHGSSLQERYCRIVGWYRNATVFRNYQELEFTQDDGEKYIQAYNVIARAENCVLLPMDERSQRWWAPRKKKTNAFGFGQANVWYAEEEAAQPRVKEIIDQIEKYRGQNWLHRWPDV